MTHSRKFSGHLDSNSNISLFLWLSVFSFLLSEIRELTYFWSAVWRHFTRVSLRPHCALSQAEPPCPLTDGWTICCYLPVLCSGMPLNNGTHVGNVNTGMSRDKNGNCSHFLLHSVAKCVEMRSCSRINMQRSMTSIRFFYRPLFDEISFRCCCLQWTFWVYVASPVILCCLS